MEKTYTYSGPLSAVTLAPDKEHPEGRHVQLVRGLRVTLPDDNDYVMSLLARKHLEPVEEPEPAVPAASPAAPAASTPPAVAPTSATAEIKTTQAGPTSTATGV